MPGNTFIFRTHSRLASTLTKRWALNCAAMAIKRWRSTYLVILQIRRGELCKLARVHGLHRTPWQAAPRNVSDM